MADPHVHFTTTSKYFDFSRAMDLSHPWHRPINDNIKMINNTSVGNGVNNSCLRTRASPSGGGGKGIHAQLFSTYCKKLKNV